MEPKFRINDTVRQILKKENIGTIIAEPIKEQGVYWYKVKKENNQITTYPESALEKYDRVKDVSEYFKGQSFSGIESFVRLMTYNKIKGGYNSNPTSLKASRTIFQPYQYKPLLKFLLSNDQRLLIADEVGLGKTIEAGHIILEMNAREPLRTLLIICPKSLSLKWQNELYDKFYINAEIYDKRSFMKFLKDYEKGRTRRYYGILSYQSMRNIEVINRIREVNPVIDLIIFDEMHWTRNESSNTNRMARHISEFATSVVGLTATPIMIGNRNLFNILRILNPYEFNSERDFELRLDENRPIVKAIHHVGKKDYGLASKELEKLETGESRKEYTKSALFESIKNRLKSEEKSNEYVLKLLRDLTEFNLLSHIITRTRRRDVDKKSERNAISIKIKFTKEEREFYDLVTRYVRRKYSKWHLNGGASFALMMPQRQIASCIPFTIEKYLAKTDIQDYYEDIDTAVEFSSEAELREINKEQKGEIKEELKELFKKLRSEGLKKDSKFDEFYNAIKTIMKKYPKSKILVFSFFKGTVRYLSKTLAERNIANYMISGDLNHEERHKIIMDFRERDDKRIMFSTEVGSEGLDMEFCNVVVNYDLPWNPMVVEQRIGRLDRIGQKSEKIMIINLTIEDTIESRILERLYERLNIFKESIGDLESILGDEIQRLTTDLLSLELTAEEEENRIKKTADIIMQRKLDAQKLEEESIGLLTYDEYFRQELSAILQEKRYVTPSELYVYIREFLKNNFKNSYLKETDNSKEKELYVCKELEHAIRESLRKNNEDNEIYAEFTKTLRLAENRILKVTFDSEYAFNNQNIIYISNFHPLTKFISEYYKSNQNEIFPCSAIEFSTGMVPRGFYFYFTYEFTITGGQDKRFLTHIIINENNEKVLNDSESSIFMSEIIENGRSMEPNVYMDKFDLGRKLEISEIKSLKKISSSCKEIQLGNELKTNKQIDIQERTYDYKINRIEQTIEDVKYDRIKAKIIPALRGQLNKLTTEKEEMLRKLNKNKDITSESRLISAGIIYNEGIK